MPKRWHYTEEWEIRLMARLCSEALLAKGHRLRQPYAMLFPAVDRWLATCEGDRTVVVSQARSLLTLTPVGDESWYKTYEAFAATDASKDRA